MTSYLHDYRWKCYTQREIHRQDQLHLIHLYQPIVGTVAVGLYVTLGYQSALPEQTYDELYAHSHLIHLMDISYEELLQARYKLEGVGLLETYERMAPTQEKYLEYQLIPPLFAHHFFQSDVLSLTLYHRLGKSEFRRLKEKLVSVHKPSDLHPGENITKSFQEVFDVVTPFHDAENLELESQSAQQIQEPYAEGKTPDWGEGDLAIIQSRLSTMIRPQAWTRELEEQLQEIRFLYQLDIWGLLKAIQNPYVTRNGEIHLERLRSYIRSEYQLRFGRLPMVRNRDTETPTTTNQSEPAPKPEKLTAEELHFQQLAKMSPLELLSHYQGGAQIPTSEVKLVESLIRDFQLPPCVVNVLLDYVLIKCDRKLPKPFVEKIAAHWKRIGIQTVEQAREQAKKQNIMTPKKAQPVENQKPVPNNNPSIKTSLPKAVAKQLKAQTKTQTHTGKLSKEEMEKKQKQIQAKLKVMNESLHAWVNQQNHLP